MQWYKVIGDMPPRLTFATSFSFAEFILKKLIFDLLV
jgi:hypothetical protein